MSGLSRTEDSDEQTPFGRALFWIVAIGAVLAFVFLIPEQPADAPPPEPTDPSTRVACRQWQVTVAASGITDLPDADPETRWVILDDFLLRAEATAAIREAEQETFLAIVESISAARELRDTAGPRLVEVALTEFTDRVSDVDATCAEAP